MTLLVEAPEKVPTTECISYGPPYKDVKKEIRWTRRIKEYIKHAWAFRSKVTVEPFVVCYMLPSVLAGLAVQNLCLEKSCLVNLNYDPTTCKHIMQGKTLNYTQQEKNAQAVVTTMTAWSNPLQSALPTIPTLFLGAWSDRTGNRKPFMILPILGKLVATLGLIMCTIFFMQVGVNETALIEGLPPALAGGRVAVTMAVYSYVSDITTESERTFRLGIVTATLTLSRPIGLALSGYMIQRFGYYVIFTIACVFYLTGFVYISLRLKSKPRKTVDENESKDTCVSVFSLSDLVATVNVAFRKREYARRLQILLVLFTHMLIVGPVLGESQMTYWFMRYKFKFTEVDYSLFLTYSVLIGSVGSFITIYVCSKRWKMDDSIIGVIACCSRIAASLIYALAPTRTVYFLGPLLDMFSSAGATSVRSIATKLVHDDEIGKTSSLISISESLVPIIYTPIYSMVYKNSLERGVMPGAFYLISAALALLAIFTLGIISYLRRQEFAAEKDKVEKTETKPKESEITRF